MKVKLVDYQLNAIACAIKHSFDELESMILDKYNAYALEDLNATDFDEIMEDIQDWHYELNEKHR